jgi:hypothetical protein
MDTKKGAAIDKEGGQNRLFARLDIKKQTLINIVLWCLKYNRFIK